MTSADWSITAVSVSYGRVDIGLQLQEGRKIEYASLNQASELVTNLPYAARKLLLAPIKDGLIDPQSAFYRIDAKHDGQMAVCVEDFVHLASTGCPNEEAMEAKQTTAVERYSNPDSAEDDSTIPPRLLDALLLLSDEEYSTIDEDRSSSGYSSQSSGTFRLRGYSTISEGSSDSLPAIPSSRPPDCRDRSNSSISVISQLIPENEELSHSQLSNLSVLQMIDSERGQQQQVQQPFQDEERRFQKGRVPRGKLILSVLMAFIILGMAALLIYLVMSPGKSTGTSAPGLLVEYDCVDGSRSLVLINHELRPLVDLKIPEMLPTVTYDNLEYLVVTDKMQRKYAHKFCTAWCGYLVPINDREQNHRILEHVKWNMPELSSYWIGVRGWKGNWYKEDESNVTFLNFVDPKYANESIVNTADDAVEINSGCVQADSSGMWSTMYCDQLRPFVCERNTASKTIRRTPFHPYQEKTCARVGGNCIYDTDCDTNTSQTIINLCPLQAYNIRCCVPNSPVTTSDYNSPMNTCDEAGGVCNHVAEDECRGGKVIFDLKVPCPDRPRKLDCCVQSSDTVPLGVERGPREL